MPEDKVFFAWALAIAAAMGVSTGICLQACLSPSCEASVPVTIDIRDYPVVDAPNPDWECILDYMGDIAACYPKPNGE